MKTNCQYGATIIELLLVIAIIAIIGASSGPVYSNFFARNYLHEKTSEIIYVLRTAQTNAISGKGDSKWGISISSSKITLFKGNTYLTRDTIFDQTFNIPQSLTITPAEIRFDKVTGNPDSTASITLTSNANQTRTVSINQTGAVNVQ